ncbi:MAG: C4-dicarboxylate ABC transporter permease [Streptosporangiales bacterium]|nr:C4-dicarboxylate ABC transporter permease [Streptosporangiales bacterium]
MLAGLLDAITPMNLLFICLGTVTGVVVGALPGLTATMGTALLLPFTFVLPPVQGLAMLSALYVASMFADSIPACLVNTPGTPSAMATALDGFPLTKQGKGQQAIVASAFSSFVGTTIGALAFLFLAAPLTAIALTFGPPEFFWVGVFALTIIGSMAGKSLLKGLAGGAIGLMISMIGTGPGGEVRYTFGISQLQGGISLAAALIGIFALPQVLNMVADRRQRPYVARYTRQPGVALQTVKQVAAKPLHLLRAGLIGAFVGILPGAGSPVASLVAYNETVRWSRDKSRFGKGALEGVTASETAGNAAAGGAMVPLVALGVPGSAPAAVIMGALLLQGMQPGPDLFSTNGSLVYAFAFSILIAGVTTYMLGSLMSRAIARMVSVPIRLLAPLILFLSTVGAFAIRNHMFDVYMMLALGIGVWLLMKIGFHPGPIGLGVILGPIVEPALLQSLAIVESSSMPAVFLGSVTNIVLITLTVASLCWIIVSRRKDRKKDAADTTADESSGEKTPA